ncbi:hypothetical protein C7T35_33185 [Variovorax sp. WS11]|nr:hypothetical protein C7T35_33185 [Variovorax sp. WS11]
MTRCGPRRCGFATDLCAIDQFLRLVGELVDKGHEAVAVPIACGQGHTGHELAISDHGGANGELIADGGELDTDHRAAIVENPWGTGLFMAAPGRSMSRSGVERYSMSRLGRPIRRQVQPLTRD